MADLFKRFTADDLAAHPHWKLLTSPDRHKKLKRRMFSFRADSKKYGKLIITDSGTLIFQVRKQGFRAPLPETYRQFMRVLTEFTEFNRQISVAPTKVFKGYDGAIVPFLKI